MKTIKRKCPEGTQCLCPLCDELFATVTDFTKHQETFPQKHPREGVPTGRCFHPSDLDLEKSNGVWGTRAGNANRARKAAGLAASRRAH